MDAVLDASPSAEIRMSGFRFGVADPPGGEFRIHGRDTPEGSQASPGRYGKPSRPRCDVAADLLVVAKKPRPRRLESLTHPGRYRTASRQPRVRGAAMHLSTLKLSNFRSCQNTTIEFSPDLTVLVGENASGKSAVIDALRHATYPVSGRSSAWFDAERDLNRLVDRGEPVSISTRYKNLTESEQAIYMAELLDAHDDLIYTASFATGHGTPRRSQLSWAVSETHAEDPEPALRRRISHVYLPPLRDAVRDIDGGDQTQLHEVVRLLIGADQDLESEFVSHANAAISAIAEHATAERTRDAIENFFTQATPPNRQHRLGLSKREMDLRRITRLLRLQLAENDLALGDVASTGLGYANLLYIAMIVLQLARAEDSDLTLLLVEEPEAHLHPQLQLVLLNFLQQQANRTRTPETETDDPYSPETDGSVLVAGERPASGFVQVIVTTHSPVLASTVSTENVVVIARAPAETTDWSTKATALKSLGLKPTDRRKIDRYLTSTRAQLLFARDVILVEGVAEMVLLPALAAYHLADPAQPTITRAALQRQFRSTTIISVEGVDFEPYLSVLLDGEHPRVDRVVVVTDGDNGAGEARSLAYRTRFGAAATSGRLHVVVGGTTLEAEMFRSSANESLLHEAFKLLRPGSDHHWQRLTAAVAGQEPDIRAEKFAEGIKATSPTAPIYLDIGKGEFAHLVAEAVELDQARSLVVPDYLAQAIHVAAHVQPPAGATKTPPPTPTSGADTGSSAPIADTQP